MNDRLWAAHILEISPEADEKQIRKAYLKKAWRWHPDVNPGVPEAAENFIKIQKAYEVLCRKKGHYLTTSETVESFRSWRSKDRWRRFQKLRAEKRKQKAEAILASRTRLMTCGWRRPLKVMYVLSVAIWLIMPVVFGAIIFQCWRFPLAERLAVVVLCLLLWVIPGFFLLQFLVHLRFIWNFKSK